jgi:hypothetical protein
MMLQKSYWLYICTHRLETYSNSTLVPRGGWYTTKRPSRAPLPSGPGSAGKAMETLFSSLDILALFGCKLLGKRWTAVSKVVVRLPQFPYFLSQTLSISGE